MLKINFSGMAIYKPGYYGCPWWDHIWRKLRRERKFNDQQITTFLKMTDTLIRLDLHEERLWRQRDVK